MTALAARPPATLPAEHFEVLKRYAAGRTLDQISSELDADTEAVQHVIQSVAKFSRPRAAQLVREHETWLRNTALRTAATEPVVHPAPPVAEPSPPVITVTRPDKPATAAPVDVREHLAEQLDQPVIGDVADLLDAAERTGVTRLVRLAERVREQIRELQTGVTEHARRQQLLDEETRLRARLAEIRTQLRGEPAPAADPAPSAQATPTAKQVRDWAAANDIECNPHGRVPQAVVDQYLAAH